MPKIPNPLSWLNSLLNDDKEYEGYGTPTHSTIAVLIADYVKLATGVDVTAGFVPSPPTRSGPDFGGDPHLRQLVALTRATTMPIEIQHGRFSIVSKQDFGSQPFWLDGRWVCTGFVVIESATGCNCMPGACWFMSVEDAKKAADVWDACNNDPDRFWRDVGFGTSPLMSDLGFDAIAWRRGDEDCLHGQVSMGGIMFHASALKVDRADEGAQIGTKDPYDRLDDLSRLQGDGAFHTVKINGHPGDWVVWFAPHQQ